MTDREQEAVNAAEDALAWLNKIESTGLGLSGAEIAARDALHALLADHHPADSGRVLHEFRGDGVWRDNEGTVWVRQSEAVEAVTLAVANRPTEPDEDVREALARIVKHVSQKFGGPSMAEFENTPPIRKHYATVDAILARFHVTPRGENR